PDAERPDGRRHALLRPAAGLARPADQVPPMSAEVQPHAAAAAPAVPLGARFEEPETKVWLAPQWRLVWWRFRKHRLAMVAGGVVLWLYLVALLADVLA